MTMFWESMLNGLCAGAYVIGLVLSLGLMASLLWLLCAALGYAFGDRDERPMRRREHGDTV